MTRKNVPLNKNQLEAIAKRFPTPFYLYDEHAIRENVRHILRAFSGFDGFFEHFAVKALPNPAILALLREEGIGADCSSLPELLLAGRAGITGEALMFTSNQTRGAEYRKARELGALINLDDITHIGALARQGGMPDFISFRYNPGSRTSGNAIIGEPLKAKYGLTFPQLIEAYQLAREAGARRFGLHTMVASNELRLDYHIQTARLLFETAVEIKRRAGITLECVNLGGGIGIPYLPDAPPVDFPALARGIRAAYDDILVPAGLCACRLRAEWGRVITGPYGYLVARAIHKKEIYRSYIGLDASMADLMRPALYGAYHHITVAGKEDAPASAVYDVVGGLCENNDKFAIERPLPAITVGEDEGDLVIIHDAGAHGRAMGFNYNGKLRPGELLLREDGSVLQIRRPETVDDYFATLTEGPAFQF